MANFEHNPGGFSVFVNNNKRGPSSPDYFGDGKDLDGNPIKISVWVKQGKNGDFLSGSIMRVDQSNQGSGRQANPPPRIKPQPKQDPDFEDSDIPF